jgi:hypothetical protein
MSWYYHDTAFPGARKLTRTLAYTPHAPGALCRSPSAPLTTCIEPSVSYGVTRMAITVPRAPSPPWGVPPPRVVGPRPQPALPGLRRSSGLMRQPFPLSCPTRSGLGPESLQVAACPCWEKALPDVISSIAVEVLGLVPRRASAVRLPVASRRAAASPYVQQVRRAETPAMIATSMTNPLRGCSHALMFRLPHLRGPQVAPPVEAHSLLGSWAVYATQRTCGYPSRTGVSLRACIGQWARRDLHPLD